MQGLLPFHSTRNYLSNVFFVKQMSDVERLALIARLNRHMPMIVMHYGRFPASRCVRMLPKEIRALC
ncbi:hypothetical protein [Pseudomonas sp. G166]|uniref:hypothetical protein n=1 Tax=Pseudomonas sp. G166 TaxID=3094846 RepID=UPI00300BD7A7